MGKPLEAELGVVMAGDRITSCAHVHCFSHLEAPMQYAFHIGQLVHVVRPSSGYVDNRTYCIICQLPSEDGGNPVYRIKNTVGAERLVRQSEIEPAAVTSVP
jgi:hypothetical protein